MKIFSLTIFELKHEHNNATLRKKKNEMAFRKPHESQSGLEGLADVDYTSWKTGEAAVPLRFQPLRSNLRVNLLKMHDCSCTVGDQKRLREKKKNHIFGARSWM